jgi:glycosyltransferase involved in cell wall biosynthesis
MRIMVLAAGPMDERLAGPEIRALEFTKALSKDFEVTLLAQRSEPTTRDGVRVLPARRQVVASEAARADVVLSPFLPPYLLALKPLLKFSAISDQYDPYELELATLPNKNRERHLRTLVKFRALQLRQADVVLCAAERQREALTRAASQEVVRGERLRIEPVVIPFGISPPPSGTGRRRLREHFPAIGADDKVIIWWGSVWKWLDAETVIQAVGEIAQHRADIKLVITAGQPPNKNSSKFDATESAVALARDLGLDGRSVFFLQDWIPYEERYDYLKDADLGITLHRSDQEARLAARARYMDYLSVGIPCVLGRGDEVADDFETAGYAVLVDQPDPSSLARQLLALLDDPTELERRRAAGMRLAQERQWSAIGEHLRAVVRTSVDRRRGRSIGAQASDLGLTLVYYWRRVVDRLGERLASD